MAPWIMTQRWNDLLFLHYALPPEVVRPLVPDALTLDTYQQQAWVSVIPFWINHSRPPGVPSVPWFSHFAEVNVRTYVTRDGKPGAYWQAAMKIKGRGGPRIEYASRRQHGPKPAKLRCSYGPSSPMFQAHPGSLEHFLTERYCLYTYNRKRLYRGEIHHLPWELQRAAVELSEDSMAGPAGLVLPLQPDLSYFARELKVLFWAPERLL
jgi:uncharacterized protein YqjF (DUF2071 family)